MESLAEHEALEYLLFFCIPRQDTNPLAHALLDAFGSFSGVLEADEAELRTVAGIGPKSAAFLHMLGQTERYAALSRSRPRRSLSDTAALAEYLMPLFRAERQERFLLLALDERRRLLRTVWLADGASCHVDVSVRRIVAEAANASAAYVVLAHNHPDGTALPSREDLLSTAEAARALALVEVRILDHFILAGDGWLSLRDSGRLAACLAPGRL